MSRYPACSEPDVEALLRALNAILKVADAAGTGRKGTISASIRFLGEQGGIGLDMWSADLDPAHVLEAKVGDVMRAVAAVALSHEFPVPLIRRYVEPLRKLLELGEEFEEFEEFEGELEPGPRPPRSPAPPRLG